jgi:hypothetical protein
MKAISLETIRAEISDRDTATENSYGITIRFGTDVDRYGVVVIGVDVVSRVATARGSWTLGHHDWIAVARCSARAVALVDALNLSDHDHIIGVVPQIA